MSFGRFCHENLNKPILGLAINVELDRKMKRLDLSKKYHLSKLLDKWLCRQDRAPRKGCLVQVDYSTGRRVFHDFASDISATGLFIETLESFKVGEKATLTFTLNQQYPFKLPGEVARCEPTGIAVRFTNLSPSQFVTLRNFVEWMDEVKVS